MNYETPIKVFQEDDIALGYTIACEVFDYRADFKVYTIFLVGDDEHIEWETAQDMEPTPDMNKAAIYLHGHVKWDGCSNWEFDAQEACMLHFCSQAALVNIGTLLSKCYDLAKAHVPRFSD